MNTKLETILNEALKSLNYEYETKVVKSNIDGVDFQCDDAFKLAKSYHKAPYMIAEEVVEKIKENDKNILQAVLAVHSRPDKQMDETIEEFFVKDMDRARYLSKLFKDADALDRVRLGDLNEKYLRNDFSHDLIDFSNKLFEKYLDRQ